MSRRVGAVLVAATIAVAGCSPDGDESSPSTTGPASTAATTTTLAARTAPDPAACQALAVNAVEPAQAFLDGLAGVTTAELEAMDPAPDFTAVQTEIQRRADDATALGCDPVAFQQTVDAAVAALTGEGEVAEQLAAVLRGEAAPEVAGARETEPTEVEITPDDDLAATIARVAPGSTVTLAAGTYELAQTLLVDADLRLVGAGRDRTIVESSADGVALAFVGPGGLEVEGMTIRHTGDTAATVLLAIEGPVAVRDAELSGAVAGTGQEGGGHGLAFAYEPVEGLPERTDAERAGDLVVESGSSSPTTPRPVC